MKQLDAAQKTITAILTAVVTGLFGWGQEELKDLLKTVINDESKALFLVLILASIVVFVSMSVFPWLIEGLIGRSAWLRRQILGSRFVEGDWLDITWPLDEEKNESNVRGGLIRIWYDDGKLCLNGETFDKDGIHVGQFGATFSDLSDVGGLVLSYGYRKIVQGSSVGKTEGLAVYHFDASKDVPTIFDGEYFSSGGRPIRLHGERVEEKDAHRVNNKDERPRLVKEFIKKKRSVLKAATP